MSSSSSERGTKRTSSSTSGETTTTPDPKRKKVKATRFSAGPKTKWTAAQVLLLLDNLFHYIQINGRMPHSVSKKSIRPKKEDDDDEEDEEEDGEIKEKEKEKMTAGDKAWEIVATGTEHMNRGAYDKWINLKDKVQPSLMDKAFEHVKKELINAAEKTVKEEKPELKGDAYSTQLQSLMNSWTTRICLLHTKPSDIIVQPATQVSDYKDTHLHTLINQSMNITVIDDPTTPLTLGILTDKISACMTAINSKTTGSQSQSQSQLQSQSQSQSTNNIQQQMKPTLETKNTIKQHNAIILHHPTTQQHNPTTQQHINSSLPVLPPIRMIEEKEMDEVDTDTDIETTSSSHRMKGREKKEKIPDKKKHAQEIAYRQAILNAVTSISEHIAKMAQQSTIRLRDKYPTPTTFYRDWNLNTDVITKLPSNIRSSIDLVDLDYTVLVNAGVSIGKANAIMKTLDAFITTGRV